MNLDLMRHRLQKQFPVRPGAPFDEKAAIAAVLVILYPRSVQPHVLLIKRSDGLRSHPGEIGFPGGLFEEGDRDLLTTALRETHEELNLAVPPEDVIAQLPSVRTRTRIQVTPFVAIQSALEHYTPNHHEVEEVLEAPLVRLFNSCQPERGEGSKTAFAYWYRHHRIWGATAHILLRLSEAADVF